MYKTLTLNNGLRIVAHPMNERESVSIGIWIGIGGRYEDKKDAGISHFLEHILFKGTPRRGARQIKEEIEGKGGSLNGFTSEEFTCYIAKLPAKHIKVALDILSDMVLNAKLTKNDIESERTVILEEIRLYKDLPNHYVHELLNGLLWPEQPLGMLLSGTFESVRAITKDDISAHKKRFYCPANMVVAVAGRLPDPKGFVNLIEALFDKQPNFKVPTFIPADEIKNGPKTDFLFKQTEQTHLCMGTYAPFRDHPDRHILGLLHVVLGANMSSRLFHEVRDRRGLAYEIGSHIIRYKDTGAFIVDAGCEPDKVVKTVEVILRELRKIKDRHIGRKEFSKAQEYYIGQLLLALEDTADHMLWLGENLIASNRLYTKEEILKEINKLMPEDLSRLANQIFSTKNLNLAIIGPIKDRQKKSIERALEL